jgi:hypothetical protein
MTSKESLLKEIEQIPEPYWEQLLEIMQDFRKHKIQTFRGRPLLKLEEITEKNFPYPPEQGYEELWEGLNKDDQPTA